MSEDNDIYVQERAEGEIIYKVVVIGDPAIGKTSLIRKFVEAQFEYDYIPTVGVSISKQPIQLKIGGKDYTINLMLWDLAGQPVFHLLHKVYYKGANGIILGFDLTRQHTFSNTKNWYQEAVKSGLSSVPIIMVGNKNDLKEQRAVSKIHVDHMMEQLGIQDYFETSALTGENVQLMFETIARRIFEYMNAPKL